MVAEKELEARVEELEARLDAVEAQYSKRTRQARPARVKKLEAQMNRVLQALNVAGWGIKKGEFIPESKKDEHGSISAGE